MKKARNAISKKEVNGLLSAAIASHEKNSSGQRLGQYIWVKLFHSKTGLYQEAVNKGLPVFDSDEHIPAFLNFITKEE